MPRGGLYAPAFPGGAKDLSAPEDFRLDAGDGSVEDGSFKRRNGVFKEFCKKALEADGKECVFIIDEINRGELSKIFGELFYSIEPD